MSGDDNSEAGSPGTLTFRGRWRVGAGTWRKPASLVARELRFQGAPLSLYGLRFQAFKRRWGTRCRGECRRRLRPWNGETDPREIVLYRLAPAAKALGMLRGTFTMPPYTLQISLLSLPGMVFARAHLA